MTPSVTLVCDISEDPHESFYAEQIHVSVKDSVFDGSDPIRHTSELLHILQQAENKQFLSIFTDGGGDHNITYLFVQCCLLALFKIGNFDVLNVGRCAPYQSYTNPAERMSLLNIGLQGLALARDDAGAYEATIKSCKSMNALRQAESKTHGLKAAYHASIEHARKTLENAFSSLQLKGKQVRVYPSSRESTAVVNALNRIEPLIKTEENIPHAIANLTKYPALERFLESHMTDGLYLLQFRKCEDQACCQRLVTVLPPMVPAPIIQPNGDHYLKFQDLYGKVETNEKDCPSLKTDEKRSKPSGYKYLASRVVHLTKCSLCGKSRCVYSMTNSLGVLGQLLMDDFIYSCGAILPSKTLYTSPSLTCRSNIEHTYYSARTSPKLICVHCGSDCIMAASYKQKLLDYKTAFPTCKMCADKGKFEVVIEKSKRSGKKSSTSSEPTSTSTAVSTSTAIPSSTTISSPAHPTSHSVANDDIDLVITNRKRKQ